MKSSAKKWRRDRAWLKKIAADTGDAANWPAERADAVEERLRRILTRTVAADDADRAAMTVGMEAVAVVVAIEGCRQEAELAANFIAGRAITVAIRLKRLCSAER